MKLLFAIILSLAGLIQTAKANETDSIRLSLITCAPGQDAVYTLFGHTALRYEEPAKGVDVVFNYGIFSFQTPNFVWRFVKGETDYMLAANTYADFMAGYLYENRTVWQQTLNLTPAEKEKLFNALITNLKPENRIYRYNFFFDNCATRPRDKIEECLDGTVSYQATDNRQTFRDIVHESALHFPWDRFGMDFCLGSKADVPIAHRQEMFAPLYLMEALKTATVTDHEGTTRPLVGQTKALYTASGQETPSPTPFTPFRTFLLLFMAVAALSIYGIRRQKSLWWLDMLLFGAAGAAGCILFLLNFFSQHPAVSPNYLLAVFHPLHLLMVPLIVYHAVKRRPSGYHIANIIVLTLFILLWPLIPQYFNPAILPMALSLLLRSGSNLLLTQKKWN